MNYCFKYIFLCFFMISHNTFATQNSFQSLLKKVKDNLIKEKSESLIDRSTMPTESSDDEDKPTLAEDPLGFAAYYWAYELSFFDKK